MVTAKSVKRFWEIVGREDDVARRAVLYTTMLGGLSALVSEEAWLSAMKNLEQEMEDASKMVSMS